MNGCRSLAVGDRAAAQCPVVCAAGMRHDTGRDSGRSNDHRSRGVDRRERISVNDNGGRCDRRDASADRRGHQIVATGRRRGVGNRRVLRVRTEVVRPGPMLGRTGNRGRGKLHGGARAIRSAVRRRRCGRLIDRHVRRGAVDAAEFVDRHHVRARRFRRNRGD